MKKKQYILVPTDFSPASRAGIRFAIQWSRQQNVHLVFAHVLKIIRLTQWSNTQYDVFAASERELYTKKLTAFIAGIQRRLPLPRHSWSLVLIEGITTDGALRDYCRQHPEISFVCMGTKGADGGVRRVFGTNTSNFILQTDTPVVAVPAAYRRKPISLMVYASDLANSAHELKQVALMAGRLHAKVCVLHLEEEGEMRLDPGSLKKLWKKETGRNVTVEFRKADPRFSIVKNLEKTARAVHPSLLVLFTDRRRTLFQSLLYPSNAERLTLHTSVPLLVLGKEDGLSHHK